MLNKYRKGTLDFTPKCSIKLLDGQFTAMLIYKTHLIERAKIEKISLEEIVETSETDNSSKTSETDKTASSKTI